MSDRYFISVDIEDATIRDRLAGIQQDTSDLGETNLTDPSQFHVTLNFIGDLHGIDEDRLIETLSTVDFTPFTIDIQGLGAFPSKDYIEVLWAGVNGDIDRLAQRIRAVLPQDLVDDHDFHGHVTLMRVNNIRPDEKDELQEHIKQHSDTTFGSFTVDRFKLKESVLSPDGARHTTIQEFRST